MLVCAPPLSPVISRMSTSGGQSGSETSFVLYGSFSSHHAGQKPPLREVAQLLRGGVLPQQFLGDDLVAHQRLVHGEDVGGALGLRVLDRIGKGLRDSPRDAIISLSTPKEELGRSFGYHRAMDTVGSILGPLVAYLILRFYPLHFNAVFLTAFVVGIITILTLFFISDVTLKLKKERATIWTAFARLSPQFKLYALSVFVLSVGSLPIAVLLLTTQSLGLIIADIPLFYMVYNLSYAGFSMAAGKMSDRLGARSVICLGYATLLIGYFVLNGAHSPWPLAGGFLILGLFPALTDG